MKQKKTQKNASQNYICKSCSFASNNKTDFSRHLSTTKHKMKQNETQKTQKNAKLWKVKNSHKSPTKYVCPNCKKMVKSRTTLWRHQKKCIKEEQKCHFTTVGKKEINISKNNVIVDKLIEIVEVQKTNQELTNQLVQQQVDILEKFASSSQITNNNCNNKMTINMYLNKECKDAMNLTDFVEKVQVSLADLKYTTENGYVKGISNILVKNLTDLDPKDRPIHCSDKKRMQFYVKEENKWEKDNEHEKFDKSIADVTLKQIKKIRVWEDKHPNFMHNEQLIGIWNKMMARTMGGAFAEERKKNKENIKKEVSNVIEVKNAMNN